MADDAAADRWWSTQTETAQRLAVSRDTVRRMIRSGRLPTVQIGRRKVVRNSDIERLRSGQAS